MEVTLDDEAYERFLNAKSDKEKREIIDEFDPVVLADDYDIDDYSEPDFKNYSVCQIKKNQKNFLKKLLKLNILLKVLQVE